MPHNIIESTYIFALLIMNSRFMKYHIKVWKLPFPQYSN
jgi:hypothetical protein